MMRVWNVWLVSRLMLCMVLGNAVDLRCVRAAESNIKYWYSGGFRYWIVVVSSGNFKIAIILRSDNSAPHKAVVTIFWFNNLILLVALCYGAV